MFASLAHTQPALLASRPSAIVVSTMTAEEAKGIEKEHEKALFLAVKEGNAEKVSRLVHRASLARALVCWFGRPSGGIGVYVYLRVPV